MNQFDDFPPEPLRLAAYDNMQQPSPIESHLAAAIFDGLRRTLCAHDPAYMTKHDLVFLFRDSSARDNEQALRRWISAWVEQALRIGVAEDAVLDFVARRFLDEMDDAGWNETA
ncbi:MAG: hypothetical protein KDB32_10330 [Planctomycetes bacterium]|nr:hypothetical protein [Planctomycetota bacterium]HPE79099.1 hypothetical protein [Gammaproteobacteria bacterium]